jgi:sugar-phosphatase
MVTAEDVANGKPHPEPYLAAARALGLPCEQCVVIEDSPAGLASAAAAGMRSVAVVSTHPYSELGAATQIARQLRDIQVVKGAGARLAIRIAASGSGESPMEEGPVPCTARTSEASPIA